MGVRQRSAHPSRLYPPSGRVRAAQSEQIHVGLLDFVSLSAGSFLLRLLLVKNMRDALNPA